MRRKGMSNDLLELDPLTRAKSMQAKRVLTPSPEGHAMANAVRRAMRLTMELNKLSSMTLS